MDFCEFISKPESWLAIITAGTAVFAIWQTRKQIKLSNKHQLMNRRLENYVLVSSLVGNYKDARKEMDVDNFDKTIKTVAERMVLRTELWDLKWFNISSNHESILNDLHSKLVDIRRTAIETPIVFEGADAKLASEFVEGISLFLLSSITFIAILDNHEAVKKNLYQEVKEELNNVYKILEYKYSCIIETKAVENLLKQIELK